MTRHHEVALQEADAIIMEFFMGDVEASTLFAEVARHMIEAVPTAHIRYSERIIGVAVPGERYRFYVSKKRGIYAIKYKHQAAAQPFVSDHKEQYDTDNEECNAYFAEHPELVAAPDPEGKSSKKSRRAKKKESTSSAHGRTAVDSEEVKRQWSVVRARSEAAIDADKIDVDNEVLQAYLDEIQGVLISFAKTVLPKKECDIIIHRILNKESVTLQALGEQYGVSRERVRQIEEKRWATITNGFRRSSRAVFTAWRQDLCDVLQGIDTSHYIQALAYFLKENARIGEFIIQVSAPTLRPDAYQAAIFRYSDKGILTERSVERIPQEIVDQVKNIDIVSVIQGRQELVRQGDVYKGICRNCSAPTLTVYPDSNAFDCSSCKAGGNVISYLIEYEHMDRRAAVLDLAAAYHIVEPDTYVASHTVMREAALYYYGQLKSNPTNRKAIGAIHSWGISGKSIVTLGLGYHDAGDDCALKYLTEEKSISVEALLRDGIIERSKKGICRDRMRNAVIIPTVDLQGNVVGFDGYEIKKGSFISCSPPRVFHKKENLYSLNLAVKSSKKSVIVVSDYSAYFALAGNGVWNAVSTYIPRISEEQLNLLKERFKVIIFAVPNTVDLSNCQRLCQKEGIYCEQLPIEGTALEYLTANMDSIKQRIEYFESIFPA